MITYLKRFLGILMLTTLFFFASMAQAALLTYDISVASDNFMGSGAYGESGSTNAFSGSLTVDNSFSGEAAVVDFSFVTGTQTWTESLLDASVFTINVTFDSFGELADGWTLSFRDRPGSLILASRDTLNLLDGIGQLFCNNCVDFSLVSVVIPAVTIDIRPRNKHNKIDLSKKSRLIPVAVLGSIDFDATQVDFLTVTFGPGGASPAHDGHVEDVNDDGFVDMVFHFETEETGIACGDTEATLTGTTFPGQEFTGTDLIITKGCRDDDDDD